MEQIIATADQELSSRKVKFLLDTPQQDGGQWDMVVALFQKYGVVPKTVYPESVSSSNSRFFNKYLNKLLRQDAQGLRDLVQNGANIEEIQSLKEKYLQKIFNYLGMNLGLPPQTFDFSYRDSTNELIKECDITPKDFYEKYVDIALSDYVSIINAPTEDKPYGETYTVEMLGNVVGSSDVRYLNVSRERLKELAIAQLKTGETVWFGSDVGQFSNRETGILDLDNYNFEGGMDIHFKQNKAGRLDYYESLMRHAMVLTGFDIDKQGKPIKWKVENSWGNKVGNQGYFVATDKWMDEYCYQIVVKKNFLIKKELSSLQKNKSFSIMRSNGGVSKKISPVV